jgi:hypothetical protein
MNSQFCEADLHPAGSVTNTVVIINFSCTVSVFSISG